MKSGRLLLRARGVGNYVSPADSRGTITPNRGQEHHHQQQLGDGLNSEVPRVRYTKATTSVSAFNLSHGGILPFTEEIGAHTNVDTICARNG